MYEGTTVAVTGSSGHLGTSVIPLLISSGYKVRLLKYEKDISSSGPDIVIVSGSLTDRVCLDRLVKNCSVVIHCAARISLKSNNDSSVYDTNVNGTAAVLDASLANGVKRFIHLSSIHAYRQDRSDPPLTEESPYCSDSAALYDRSKRDAEKLVLSTASDLMEVIVMNPTGIIGPDDHKPSFMGKAVIDIYKRRIPALINAGFDFCDVRDVAAAVVKAIEKGRNRNSYLLSGRWCSIGEIQDIIASVRGDNRKVPVLPLWAGYVGLPFATLYASLLKEPPLYTRESLLTLVHGNRNISSARASAELDYKCRPIEETISDTVSWFRKNGFLK